MTEVNIRQGLTAVQIEVLLHYVYQTGDVDLTTRNKEIALELTECGLLIDKGVVAESKMAARYIITPKGRAHVVALRRVPLPVQTWTTPGEEP